MSKKILVTPDKHVTSGCNLRRFDALGNYLLETKPDYYIDVGDMLEMESLYGISSRKNWAFKPATARFIEDEIDTAYQANTKIFTPLDKYKLKQKRSKKRPQDTKRIMCRGNHDERAVYYYRNNTEDFEELGYADVDDFLRFHDHFDEVYDFQRPVVVEGIVFSHNYVNGTSTASTVDTIIKLAAMSAVGGHSHKAEFKASYTSTNRPIFGLQAGWFSDPDDELPKWVGPQGGSDWWSGVVMLHGVDGTGFFDPEFISTTRLLKDYL